MKINILSISMSNFKGYKDQVLTLDGATEIVGENGVGKTTVMTAHFWLWCDRDSELHSNPDIWPIGVEETTPRVEEHINIDGKDIVVAKSQKRSVGKPNADGISKISLTNSYEINSVPKSERDFKAYFEELGLDFSLILPLSHPDSFTSQKAMDMRKVLFGMVSDLSDKDVANIIGDIPETAALLDNYTLDEVKAMQNATLRKINEDYGKNGEILNAKIEGLESAKQPVEIKGLAEEKTAIEKRIADINAKAKKSGEATANALRIISNDITALRTKYSDIIRSSRESFEAEKRTINFDLLKAKADVGNTDRAMKEAGRRAESAQNALNDYAERMQKLREEWNAAAKKEMEEGATICPTCGQVLPREMQEDAIKRFEQNKRNELQRLKDRATAMHEDIGRYEAELDRETKNFEKFSKQVADGNKAIEKLNRKLNALVEPSEPEECKAILKEIESKEAEMKSLNTTGISDQLNAEKEELNHRLMEIAAALSQNSSNIAISEKIAALRASQVEYEQARADAEKILDQLDQISRKKNELLEESINSHFKMVKFRLFTYLKNGNYAEDCTPMIDGKSINNHSNGALRMLAKLDIIDGLQRFYNLYLPVFADDFALVTNNTAARISMECQLIRLQAVHGVPLMVR